MSDYPAWLPPLVFFSGNWERYLEVIYDYFKQDFIESKPRFKGRKLGLKKHPLEKGKEATFWHFISERRQEDERLPDLRRCERIRWPKPIIEHANKYAPIKIWENKRGNETRILLWLEKQEYIVVLAERKGYLIPWTAYMVIEEHRKRKLQKEYETFINANAAP